MGADLLFSCWWEPPSGWFSMIFTTTVTIKACCNPLAYLPGLSRITVIVPAIKSTMSLLWYSLWEWDSIHHQEAPKHQINTQVVKLPINMNLLSALDVTSSHPSPANLDLSGRLRKRCWWWVPDCQGTVMIHHSWLHQTPTCTWPPFWMNYQVGTTHAHKYHMREITFSG